MSEAALAEDWRVGVRDRIEDEAVEDDARPDAAEDRRERDPFAASTAVCAIDPSDGDLL